MIKLEIRNRDGKVIHTSRNLRGIKEYVSHNLIKVMSMDPISEGQGKLCIFFDNGDSFECNFASYAVLRGFVSRWRNVKGCKCIIEGQETVL